VIEPLRTAGVMTIPELFEKRFSTKVRWLAGLFVALGGLLNMGIFLRLGGDFLVYATGMPAHYLEWVMTILLGWCCSTPHRRHALGAGDDYIQFLVVGTGLVVTSLLVITTSAGKPDQRLSSAWPPHGERHEGRPSFNPFHRRALAWAICSGSFCFRSPAPHVADANQPVLSGADAQTGAACIRAPPLFCRPLRPARLWARRHLCTSTSAADCRRV